MTESFTKTNFISFNLCLGDIDAEIWRHSEAAMFLFYHGVQGDDGGGAAAAAAAGFRTLGFSGHMLDLRTHSAEVN